MSLARTHLRRRRLSMTSLIDVIFLLLLFFMLSSTFTRFAEIRLSGAGGGTPSAAQPRFLRLDAGAMTLNGQDVTLATLAAAVSRTGEAAGQEPGAGAVLVAPVSEAVTAQRLVDVMVVLGTVPGLDVTVLE